MSDYEVLFRFADPSYSVNKQALAVLAYIAASEVEAIHPPELIDTFPMQFDGKVGVCCMYKKTDAVTEPWLLIYFGEKGNNEDLIVRTTKVRQLDDRLIGPTYKDFKSGSTAHFNEGDILGVYTEITSQLLTFLL
jgi:hypothetical protein